jgi:alcohol dehydrogenase
MPFTPSFRISAKSEVLFGEGEAQQTGKRTAAFGCSKVLCVYDKGVKGAGIVNPIIDNMQKAGLKVVEYGGVLPDPPDTMVNECGEFARREKVDGIVGIGGGSSLDTAKMANVLLTNPGSISKYLLPEGKHVAGKPLVLIPTTAGTASEITQVAVVSDSASGAKIGVGGPATIASLAIVDPLLSIGMPPHITAATGMDAFAHALESYTSMARKNGSDIEARTQMCFACLLAGMSLDDSMIHIGHAFGSALGATHHIHHGVACAIGAPAVIDVAAGVMPDKIRRVGEIMGLTLAKTLTPAELGAAVSKRIIAFNKEIGIPTLKELKVKEADLLPLAQVAAKDVGFFFLPRSMSVDDILAIVQKAYAL